MGLWIPSPAQNTRAQGTGTYRRVFSKLLECCTFYNALFDVGEHDFGNNPVHTCREARERLEKGEAVLSHIWRQTRDLRLSSKCMELSHVVDLLVAGCNFSCSLLVVHLPVSLLRQS